MEKATVYVFVVVLSAAVTTIVVSPGSDPAEVLTQLAVPWFSVTVTVGTVVVPSGKVTE